MTIRMMPMQRVQRVHDEGWHRDVLDLPPIRQAAHMALHGAKYVGRLFEAADRSDFDLVRRTVVDAFVIALCTANLLNQNLDEALRAPMQEPRILSTVGAGLLREVGDARRDILRLASALAVHVGRMSKPIEGRDHLEDGPCPSAIMEANLEIVRTLLVASHCFGIDLAQAHAERIALMELRWIPGRAPSGVEV